MKRYSLKFIAPGLEDLYIGYRLHNLLKFFKLLYSALIIINLIFAIGFFIMQRAVTIESSLGMMMAFQFVIQYCYVVHYKPKHASIFISLTNIEIALIHALRFVGFSLYNNPIHGFANGLEFMMMHILLLVSYSFVENAITLVVAIIIELIIISFNGFCIEILTIFSSTILYIYYLYQIEQQKRITFLLLEKEKEWSKLNLKTINFVDRILDLATQPYILCSFNDKKFTFEPNKVNIASQNLFELSENSLTVALRSIYIQNQNCQSIKYKYQQQCLVNFIQNYLNQYDHIYEKYLIIKNQKEPLFAQSDEEFEVTYIKGEKQFQLVAKLHCFQSFNLIFAIVFTENQVVFMNENVIQLKKKHVLLQRLISGSLKTLQKLKKIIPKSTNRLNWNILYATNQILNINYYLRNKLDVTINSFSLKKLMEKMIDELNDYCLKKHIRLILDMIDINVNSDKSLVTHLILNFVIMVMKMVPKNGSIRLLLEKFNESEGKWDFAQGKIEIISVWMSWVQESDDEERLFISKKNQLEIEIIEKILGKIGPRGQVTAEDNEKSILNKMLKFHIYGDLRQMNEYKSFDKLNLQ